ncbi:MAG: primosomal protein N' [Prolixibacteraceae bacterium]|jgi:primosomal protein N' (replication factor Y)|nr:primosomal protein N' [Prolixibacteraceae bacterium]
MTEHPILYADVLLPVPLLQEFTYHVPPHFIDKIVPGCRVIVQFGQRKLLTGIVKNTHLIKPEYDTKPIEATLDDAPILSNLQFQFWEWIAGYYMCSEGEVMKAALPSGLKLDSQTSVLINDNWEEKEDKKLSPTEESVFQFIEFQKKTNMQQINSLTKRANAYPVIKSLLQKGAVIIEEELKKAARPKTVTYIRINTSLKSEEAMKMAFENLKRAKKQLNLLMFLLNKLNFYAPQQTQTISKKELIKESEYNENTLKQLEKKGYIDLFDVEIDRLPDIQKSKDINKLNPYQEKALNEIYASFIKKDVVLLHGITASGKTEIYIKMIQEQMKVGKQVLYLLPEIALTSQIIERLTAVFGDKAGIYHSKFSDSERVEIWNKVLDFSDSESNKYQLVLGARSALLLPFKKLGLVIIDEEHETSFKQFDPAPRYNARDASVVLAKLHNAKVLMGTATPSFESYFNAKTNKYGYVQLNNRHSNIEMPEIIIADLKAAYKRKQMKSHFAPLLFEAIENALAQNEQVILFQNRRGFSPFLQCRICGWIPKCKHCDVSLTYHKFFNNLQCHYCGYSINLPSACPDCNSADIQTKGFGTEKVEDEIKIIFPNVSVGRLDYDATKRKHGFEKVLHNFSSQKTQILVGTQMITKGLDFDNVSTVGILNADNLLDYPDFRSYERAYQLMAQVSGRSGRKSKRGKVIIQTSQPEHRVINLVQKNDYETFFNTYIEERKTFRYPPWYRLINITIKHKNRNRAITASKQLGAELRKTFKTRILGPDFHLISRVQQYYQLIIRIKLEKSIPPDKAKSEIRNSIKKVLNIENNSSVQINIDVDPL